MDAYQQVSNKLQELRIIYDVVAHPPAFTTEQADSYIKGLKGVRTKSMFLTNKKKTQYYLLIMDDKKRLDMDDFKVQVGANRIRMASLDSLAEKMNLPAGTVSPFGLLNNEEKDIHVYFDKFNSLEADSNLQPDNSSLQQTLSLRDVTVSVNGHVIVQPVTFTIEKGKKYALLGDSGTGKSTLLNFLAGRNHEFTGEVILDGKSLSKEQIVQLRNITAYNPQKNHIFNATVKDNITLWEERPFEEESSQMGLNQFTNAQEVVSEHGTKLSGGQRQRLALARTLLESDKVLLLDESTANLDLESARSIEAQLLQNPNLTLVIVTHHFFEEHRDLFDEVIYLGKEKSL